MRRATPCSAKKRDSATPYGNKKWVASSEPKTCLFKHTAYIQSFYAHIGVTSILNTNQSHYTSAYLFSSISI